MCHPRTFLSFFLWGTEYGPVLYGRCARRRRRMDVRRLDIHTFVLSTLFGLGLERRGGYIRGERVPVSFPGRADGYMRFSTAADAFLRGVLCASLPSLAILGFHPMTRPGRYPFFLRGGRVPAPPVCDSSDVDVEFCVRWDATRDSHAEHMDSDRELGEIRLAVRSTVSSISNEGAFDMWFYSEAASAAVKIEIDFGEWIELDH